jgi:hypothetical protein
MKVFYKILVSILTLLFLFIYFGLIPSWINLSFFPSGDKLILFDRVLLLGIFFVGFILFTIIFRKYYSILDYKKSTLLGLFVSSISLILLWSTNWFHPYVNTASIFLGLTLLILFFAVPIALSFILLKLDTKYKLLSFANLILVIVVFNMITWFFWGRTSTLLLTNTNNINTFYYDKILIERDFSEALRFYEFSFDNFSESNKKDFIQKLGAGKTTVVERIDWSSDSLNVELTPVFGVIIIRDIPFICTIDYGTVAGMSSVSYKSFYVWFFGWLEIRDELTGMS